MTLTGSYRCDGETWQCFRHDDGGRCEVRVATGAERIRTDQEAANAARLAFHTRAGHALSVR